RVAGRLARANETERGVHSARCGRMTNDDWPGSSSGPLVISPQCLQQILKVGRQRRLKMHALAGSRMNERQLKRVQHDARRGKSHQLLPPAILPLAVRQIADQRKTQKLKM